MLMDSKHYSYVIIYDVCIMISGIMITRMVKKKKRKYFLNLYAMKYFMKMIMMFVELNVTNMILMHVSMLAIKVAMYPLVMNDL